MSQSFSGLYCITCSKDFDEDSKGNFKCSSCLVLVGVLK